MRIMFKGIKRPQSIAKKFSHTLDCSLSEAKESVAKYSGYRNWKELKQVSLLNSEDTWLTDINEIRDKWFELISAIFYDNVSKNIWHLYIFEFIVKSGWISKSFELTTFPHNATLRCALIGENKFIVCNPFCKLFEACYYVVDGNDKLINELYSVGYGDFIEVDEERSIYFYKKNENSFAKKISTPSIQENYQLPWDVLWIPDSKNLDVQKVNCNYLILSGYDKKELPDMKVTTSLMLIDCPGLEEITIPSSVVILTIRNCNNLKKVNINHIMNYLDIERCGNLEMISENAEIWKVLIDSTNKKFTPPKNIISAYCSFPSDIMFKNVEIGSLVRKISFGNQLSFSDKGNKLVFDDEPKKKVKRSRLIIGGFSPFRYKGKIETYEKCEYSNNKEWKKL